MLLQDVLQKKLEILIYDNNDAMKTFSVKFEDFIFASFISFLTIFSVLYYAFDNEGKYIFMLVSIINVIYLFRFSKVIPIFIVLLFSLLYVIEMRHFFSSGLRISYWNSFQEAKYLNKALVLHALFLFPFVFLSLFSDDNKFPTFDEIRRNNYVVFYFSIISFFILTHIGIKGETVLNSAYGSNDSEKTALYEYGIIFFIIANIYSSKSFLQKFIILFGLIWFSVKSVLYGGRVEVLQIGLAFLYMSYNFAHDIERKKLIIYGLVGLLLMTVIGTIRGNPELIFSLMNGSFSIEMIFSPPRNGIVSSNFGDVMQASSRMIGLSDTGIWDLSFRISSFISFLFNIFLYGMEFKNASNLALADQAVYGAGGGGLISSYFYVWLGWIGPVLSGFWLVLTFYFGLYKNKNNIFLYIYAFALLVTFPRWLAYSPIVLVKFGVFSMIFLMFMYCIDKFIRQFLSARHV